MKENNIDINKTVLVIGCIALLALVISFGNIGLNNDLNSCRQELDSCYNTLGDTYGERNFYNKDLKECNSDLEFVMNQCDKMAVMCDKELFLAKDKCPICPTDEICIKVVKENKFQCINRELIGG